MEQHQQQTYLAWNRHRMQAYCMEDKFTVLLLYLTVFDSELMFLTLYYSVNVYVVFKSHHHSSRRNIADVPPNKLHKTTQGDLSSLIPQG